MSAENSSESSQMFHRLRSHHAQQKKRSSDEANLESAVAGPPKPKVKARGNKRRKTEDDHSLKCPVCLIKFTRQKIGSPNTCHHNFCLKCIKRWSKDHNTCPVDRKKYSLIEVKRKCDEAVEDTIPVAQPRNPPAHDPLFAFILNMTREYGVSSPSSSSGAGSGPSVQVQLRNYLQLFGPGEREPGVPTIGRLVRLRPDSGDPLAGPPTAPRPVCGVCRDRVPHGNDENFGCSRCRNKFHENCVIKVNDGWICPECAVPNRNEPPPAL